MGFDASTTDISSHLPGPHLTHSWHAFSCAAHHEPPLTAAAHSGLGPPPAGRSRRATQPPSLVQHRSQQTRHHPPEPPPAFVFTSSGPITGPSPLLRAVPPLCPAPVPCRSQCPPLAVLPLAASRAPSPSSPGRRYRGDRFSCSVPAPATSSRHLCTGHRQGSMQAAPWLRTRQHGVPLSREFRTPPVLMPLFRLSMRQQWFTPVRLLVTHLTR